MKILGIETSCDETGIALYDAATHSIVAEMLHSQVSLHAAYGGVVPELASRDHVQRMVPLLKGLFQQAKIAPSQLDGIAYTQGPGLVGALLVGATIAKTLSLAWQIPAIGIHHLEGHLVAPLLEANAPQPPFLALLVSGGHTLLVQVDTLGHYALLGETLDDAAGEAFDKTAKMLGLGYPGGPAIAAYAQNGRPQQFYFPRPLTNKPSLNFSFSGLKTHVLHTIQKSQPLTEQIKADIALAVQDAIVDTLWLKCKRAIEITGAAQLVIAGGVGANLQLRQKFKLLETEKNVQVFFPNLKYCTDNGAMIAYAGYLRLKKGEQDQNSTIQVRTRWPLTEL